MQLWELIIVLIQDAVTVLGRLLRRFDRQTV